MALCPTGRTSSAQQKRGGGEAKSASAAAHRLIAVIKTGTVVWETVLISAGGYTSAARSTTEEDLTALRRRCRRASIGRYDANTGREIWKFYTNGQGERSRTLGGRLLQVRWCGCGTTSQSITKWAWCKWARERRGQTPTDIFAAGNLLHRRSWRSICGPAVKVEFRRSPRPWD